MTDNITPATSGAWRRTTHTPDRVPPRSLGVSADHLKGHYPEGKAPTDLPVPHIPIVVVEGAGAWGAFDMHGETPGWQRLGDTDTTDHDAYDVSTGVPIEVTETEAMALRSQDHGAVAGRLRALSEQNHENHTSTQTGFPKAGSPGYAGGGINVKRGSNGLAINNPEGIPGHETPRIQRWGDPLRRFGTALRTHDTHLLHDRRAWQSAPQTYTDGDLYGSPFDSNAVISTNGARTPERQQQPGMWDQAIIDTPMVSIDGSEDDMGFGDSLG